MAQFARPDSNVTQTGFTGGFAEIDEVTASDADFANTPDNTLGLLEVGLSNVSDPGVGTGHILRYRLAKADTEVPPSTSGNTQLGTVSLIQGTTVIAADAERTLGAWTSFALTLSAGQADAITDYTDLRIRFDSPASGGGPGGNRRGGAISWAELETPDAAAPEEHSGTLAVSGGGAVAPVVQKGGRAAATVSGGGSVTPLAQRSALLALAVSGGGVAAISTSKDASLQVTLSGGGGVEMAAVTARSMALSVSGGGAVTIEVASGAEEHSGSFSVSGGGGMALAGASQRLAPLAVSTGGAFETQSLAGRSAAVTISGGGSVSPAVIAQRSAPLEVSGGGAVLLDATSGHSGGLIISGGGSVVIEADAAWGDQRSGDVAVSGGGGIAIAFIAAREAAVGLSGGGGIVAQASTHRTVAMVMSGGGGVTLGSAEGGPPIRYGYFYSPGLGPMRYRLPPE